uniref:Uncharacterized protein n=1 Tax=Melopsittacus undulatus TaxID=13146 RepID=A0A8C6J7G9_MELUD
MVPITATWGLWHTHRAPSTHVVLPEAALPVAVGLDHHLRRLGLADGHQPRLHGREPLHRACRPTERAPPVGPRPVPAVPVLTCGLRAAACCTRSITARRAGPSPSPAAMDPSWSLHPGEESTYRALWLLRLILTI